MPISVIPKAWGSELIIANNDLYCGKILRFDAGASGSLHFHRTKDETFYLLTGRVKVEIADECMIMLPGDVLRIPPGTPHSVSAIERSEIIEVSTRHDEADVVRLRPSEGSGHAIIYAPSSNR